MKQLAYLVLLLIGCSATTWVARGGDAKGIGAKDKAPDYRRWNSNWLLTCDYEKRVAAVAVTVGRPRSSTPHIIAKFLEGEGDCTIGSGDKWRIPFLRADVTGSHLKGTIYFCTTDKKLADAKNLTAVFACDFEGDFDSASDTINGHAKSEHYTSPDGNPANYARDPAKDPTIDVTLRLVGGRGAQPVAPPNTNITPTPDPRDGINNPLINGLNGLFNGERAKNPSAPAQRPPDTNPTPTPDTFPLAGIQDTLNNFYDNFIKPEGPKNPSTPPPQNR